MNINIEQLLKSGYSELNNITPSPRIDVEVLLSHILNVSRTHLHTWPEQLVSEGEGERFFDFLARRKQHEPIAYILGHREFWSLDLEVNESTLIPRAETELLVETTLEKFHAEESISVLDLGTGTGAIALALAKERASWRITATDISKDSLAVAKRNCEYHQIQSVEFIESDWFESMGAGKFDCILSNPPYIAIDDPHLLQGDVQYEPRATLLADNDGLSDILQIISGALKYLKPGGMLLIEHGFEQGKDVANLMKSAGYEGVEPFYDLGGRQRACLGKLPQA